MPLRLRLPLRPRLPLRLRLPLRVRVTLRVRVRLRLPRFRIRVRFPTAHSGIELPGNRARVSARAAAGSGSSQRSAALRAHTKNDRFHWLTWN
jgi:hypothetical protein